MTFDEWVQIVEKEGFQPRLVAQIDGILDDGDAAIRRVGFHPLQIDGVPIKKWQRDHIVAILQREKRRPWAAS